MTYEASIDTATGCAVVFDTETGDVKLIVPDGKMNTVRRGEECEHCKSIGLEFASKAARALNLGVLANPGFPQTENGKIARLQAQVDALAGPLQDWVDSFASHIEGGEADPLIKASRAALAAAGR